MQSSLSKPVLSEATLGTLPEAARRLALVILGVAALAAAAQIRVPFWPVPVTMQSFAVLAIGAAYGVRLGGATVGAYLALGALGAGVFSDGGGGIAHLLGTTGGYLVGFLAAALLLGALAERGWDRSPAWMAGAMLLGTAAIYAPGLLWLRGFAPDWATTLDWGLWPFLAGDVAKLALAAILFPVLWRAVGGARG